MLLILAGVTIATLTGDNGLLQKATNAKQANEEGKELEVIKLATSAAQVAGNGTISIDNLNNELQANFNNEKSVIELPNYYYYKANKNYRIYKSGNVEEGSLLPDEYQQAEYIESSGIQYIDTKYIPNYLTTVICKINCASGFVFGTGKGGYYSDFALDANSSGYYRALFKKVESQTARGLNAASVACSSASNNTLCEIRIDKKGIYTNDILNEEFQQTYDFQADATMCLCVFHGNKYGEREFDNYLNGKIYYFEILDNKELHNCFIPCYTTTTIIDVDGTERLKDTIGMYDTVTGQFYGNKGTGRFGYGMEDGTYVAPQNN